MESVSQRGGSGPVAMCPQHAEEPPKNTPAFRAVAIRGWLSLYHGLSFFCLSVTGLVPTLCHTQPKTNRTLAVWVDIVNLSARYAVLIVSAVPPPVKAARPLFMNVHFYHLELASPGPRFWPPRPPLPSNFHYNPSEAFTEVLTVGLTWGKLRIFLNFRVLICKMGKCYLPPF